MRNARYLSATSAFCIILSSSAAFAANPREDLVVDWLNAASFGLPVTIGDRQFDPTTEAVQLQNVTIGDPKSDLLSLDIDKISVEDPRREGANRFAAHAIRFNGYKIHIHFDMERWFPDLIKKIKSEQGPAETAPADDTQSAASNDTPPAGSDAAGTNSSGKRRHGESRPGKSAAVPDEGTSSPTTDIAPPAAPPVIDYDIAIESMFYERPSLPMTAPDLSGGNDLMARYFAFARWTTEVRADWIEASNITMTATGDGKTMFSADYESYYASGLHDGRLERAGFSNMTETFEEDSPIKAFKIGSTYLMGVDFGAMLNAIDPAAYKDGKGDGVLHTVYAQYGANDLSWEFDGGKASLSNVELDGLQMRQTDKPIVTIVADMLQHPDQLSDDPLPFLKEALPNYGRLGAIGYVSAHDFKVDVDKTFSFGIGSMDFNNADSSGIAAMTMRELNFSMEDGSSKGSLGLLTFQDIGVGDLSAWLDIAKSTSEGGEPRPEDVRRALLEGGMRLGFVESATLSVETPMGSGGWDSLAITSGNFLKMLPQRSDLTFTNLNFPSALLSDPTVTEALTAMGYDKISLSGGMTMTWDAESGDAALEDLTLRAKDMGQVSADIHIGNLPLSIIDKPEEIEARMQEATLISGSIGYGNFGIVEKAFEFQAKKMNQDPKKFRQSTADAIPMMLTFLDDKDIQQAFEGPIKMFLNDPKSITLTVNPGKPIPFKDLEAMDGSDPKQAFKLFGVNVTANE